MYIGDLNDVLTSSECIFFSRLATWFSYSFSASEINCFHWLIRTFDASKLCFLLLISLDLGAYLMQIFNQVLGLSNSFFQSRQTLEQDSRPLLLSCSKIISPMWINPGLLKSCSIFPCLVWYFHCCLYDYKVITK